jgi:diketogulonate reductase-like aldo/keto reductase
VSAFSSRDQRSTKKITEYNTCLLRSHVDSAQIYRNEAAVGEAVKASDLKREDLFISKFFLSLLMQHILIETYSQQVSE